MIQISQEQYNQLFALYKANNDMIQSVLGIQPTNLDSYTGEAQNAPEGGIPTAYERPRVFMGLDANGKPIYKQISGKTQDQRNDNIVRAYFQSGRIWDLIPNPNGTVCATVKQSKTPVHDFAWDWFNRYKKGHLAKSTEYQMEKRLEKIVAHFDGKNIEDINTDDIHDFVADERRKNWAKATFASHISTMKEMLAYAVEKGILPANAINWKRIKNPGVEKHTRKAATVKQYEDILAHIPELENPIEKLAVSVLAYTGMRPEELYGLRWEDIDLNNDIINIQRANVYSGKKGMPDHKGTKTETSRTWVPITPNLHSILEKYRNESGWIIHDGKGNPFKNQNAVQGFWKKIKAHINLYDLKPCEFRKTVPSVMLAYGADIKVVQRLLRHKKADITINTYAEVDPDAFIKGCNKLSTTTM